MECITAIATIVMAMATIAMAVFTYYLWCSTEKLPTWKRRIYCCTSPKTQDTQY